MPPVSIHPWLVLAEQSHLRWGGDMRRHYLFAALARRTGARRVDGWDTRSTRAALLRPRGHLWTRPARVVTSETLQEATLDLVVARGVPVALDFHDDPVLQREALGLTGDTEENEALQRRRVANIAAFPRLVAPSAPFAAYAGLDATDVIVAPNGSGTSIVRPGPWPSAPTVGLVSGAAPSRGIETLIEAVRRVRTEMPDTRLLLWLAGTGPASEQYLVDLRAAVEADPWIEVGSAPYAEIGAQLSRATVLVLPTPAHPYWDSVAPVKLFDCMAVARPIVTTPRLEPARLVDEARAGAVAAGDGPDELAASILGLLADEARARACGERGREYVVANHDWATISSRLADAILAPRRYHALWGLASSR